MSGEILALEGVCCSGKTTTLRKLSFELGAGVVPELPEFGRNLLEPFTSGEAIVRNEHVYVELEKVRMRTAKDLDAITPMVVMDRSFLSTIALAYGAIDLIGVENFKRIADKVLGCVEKLELPLPDKIIYINVDSQTVKTRNQTRTPPLEQYWVEAARIDRQNHFYQSLELEWLSNVNGAQNNEDVVAECLSLARQQKTSSAHEFVSVVRKFGRAIP